MVLADEGGSGEISQVKGFNLVRLHVGVGEAILAGLYRERAQIPIRKGSERRLSGSGYNNCPHVSRVAGLQAGNQVDVGDPGLAGDLSNLNGEPVVAGVAALAGGGKPNLVLRPGFGYLVCLYLEFKLSRRI